MFSVALHHLRCKGYFHRRCMMTLEELGQQEGQNVSRNGDNRPIKPRLGVVVKGQNLAAHSGLRDA
jgi:hypothetical protein